MLHLTKECNQDLIICIRKEWSEHKSSQLSGSKPFMKLFLTKSNPFDNPDQVKSSSSQLISMRRRIRKRRAESSINQYADEWDIINKLI